MNKERDNVEVISSEVEDYYSDDSLFNISSWGADLSFRELTSMYNDDELIKPELQRKYVWDKIEASRFVESILLGLPVPSIFLAQAGSQKLIIDGYQRIMTVYDYMRGVFSTDGKIFRLADSEKINKRWRKKAFSELSMDDQRKIKSTTIHAIIFEQKKPENDDTSLYQIFERINTGGRTLTSQEIRNCIYQGTFNALLFKLNENLNWRKLFGSKSPDSRMRDIEYILRFFVMKSAYISGEGDRISLKKSLNMFMNANKDADEQNILSFQHEFEKTIQLVINNIGEDAFHNYMNGKFSSKFHPAIYDAVMVATFMRASRETDILPVSHERHKDLFDNMDFKNAISVRTTNIENIRKRISMADKILFEDD